jgi:hypothetical protein
VCWIHVYSLSQDRGLELVGVSIALESCIREVLGSNLDRKPGSPDRACLSFSWVCLYKYQYWNLIRSQPLSFKSNPIHHLLLILPFHAAWSTEKDRGGLWKCSCLYYRSRIVDLYFHSPIRLHSVVLNYLSEGQLYLYLLLQLVEWKPFINIENKC